MIWQVSGGSRNRIILARTQQIVLLLFYNVNQHLLREYTMPDIVLSTFFILTHLTLTTTRELGTSIKLMLPMRKVRHKKGKSLKVTGLGVA